MSVDAVDGVATDVLRAVGEPVRWRIIERLAEEELCVCHLVDDLGLPQPLVSHHLKALRIAGVVESDRYKRWTYYRLVPEVLAAVADELAARARTARRAGRHRRPCC
jgi:ArsR family transcriptional regulator